MKQNNIDNTNQAEQMMTTLERTNEYNFVYFNYNQMKYTTRNENVRSRSQTHTSHPCTKTTMQNQMVSITQDDKQPFKLQNT